MKQIAYRLCCIIIILVFPGIERLFATVIMSENFQLEKHQDTTALKTLYDSAKFYSRNDPVLSKNLLNKLIAITKSNDSSRLHDYYTLYGNACVLNGDFKEAQYYYNKSLALNTLRKDTLEQIRIYNNLNYLYMLSGRLDLSLQNAHEGVRLIEMMSQKGTLPVKMPQFGNKTSAWVHSYFYSNIGQVNLKVGNNKEALEYFKRALQYIEKGGDKTYYANALNDVASTYRQLKQYDQALFYCRKAIAVNKEIDNQYGIGLSYQTMGDIYAHTEHLGDAEALLNEGMEILERSDDITAQSYTLLSIVGLEIRSGQLSKAEKNLAKCYELVTLSNDLRTQKEYYYYKFMLDSINGRGNDALVSYMRYHALDKQITDVRLSQRIAEIQASFEMQRKEQENKLLKSENEVQKMRITKARTILILLTGFFSLIFVITLLIARHQRLLTEHKVIELKQKNLNQQMNPHFVYNCLTSIQYYIFHNDTEKSLEYLSKFSKLMRKILESSQNQYMSVQDEIEMLTLYLKLESIRFKGKFDYSISVDDRIDPILFKIPSLLIQPFVENSLWHGIQNKEGKGKIQVSFDLVDKSIFCAIEDNGIGRENAEKIRQSRISNHISLGASITNSRMKLLKSLYGKKLGIRYVDLKDIYNQPSGTRVELFLPILN